MTRTVDSIWKNPSESYLELPFVISYPRTGTHWLNTMLEQYFERNRVLPNYGGSITFVNKFDQDFMWYSSHDNDMTLEVKHELGTLYLYRDPVDVMYSLLTAHTLEPDHDETHLSVDELFQKYAGRYRRHLEKWLLSDKYKARTVVTYEGLKTDPLATFKKVVEHFGGEWNEKKAQAIFAGTTKEKVHDRGKNVMPAYFGKQYLSKEYSDKRAKFREQHAERVYETVVTEELRPWFEHLKHFKS